MSELTAQQSVRLEAMKAAMAASVPTEHLEHFLASFQRYVFFGPDAAKPERAA